MKVNMLIVIILSKAEKNPKFHHKEIITINISDNILSGISHYRLVELG
jgi:hypothetical protein